MVGDQQRPALPVIIRTVRTDRLHHLPEEPIIELVFVTVSDQTPAPAPP